MLTHCWIQQSKCHTINFVCGAQPSINWSIWLTTKRTCVRMLSCRVEHWACWFVLHWSSSLSCTNEYLAIVHCTMSVVLPPCGSALELSGAGGSGSSMRPTQPHGANTQMSAHARQRPRCHKTLFISFHWTHVSKSEYNPHLPAGLSIHKCTTCCIYPLGRIFISPGPVSR